MSDNITIADLAHRRIWVGWRNETRDGRQTKIPYDPTTSERRAESDNPATWATREEAEFWAARERGDGVGVMFSLVDDKYLAGVDLDTCRDPETGEIEPWAQEVIDRLSSYTEISPSQTGAKIFFVISAADLPTVIRLFEGKHGRAFKNGGGEHAPAIEIHISHR